MVGVPDQLVRKRKEMGCMVLVPDGLRWGKMKVTADAGCSDWGGSRPDQPRR